MYKAIITVGSVEGINQITSLGSALGPCAVFIVLYDQAAACSDEDFEISIARAVAGTPSSNLRVESVDTKNRLAAINKVVEKENLLSGDDPLFILDESVQVGAPFAAEMMKGSNPPRLEDGFGRSLTTHPEIAMCGACLDFTDCVDQRVVLTEAESSVGLHGYAGKRLAYFAGSFSLAGEIDGKMLCLWPCARRVTEKGKLLDETLGEYAWQDLCIRLRNAQMGVVVSEACFGAVLAKRHNKPESIGSVSERLLLFSKHEPSRKPSVGCVYRATLKTVQDLNAFRASIAKSAQLCDSLVVVLKNNPLDIQSDMEFSQFKDRLGAAEKRLFQACDGAGKQSVEKEFGGWVASCCRASTGKANVRVATIIPQTTSQTADINEGIKLSEQLGSDAVFVLDHDEVLDDQLYRSDVERMLLDPNPMVYAYDLGIVYHWDSPALIRTEPPFGPTKSYEGGPSAPRLFRKIGNKLPRCHNTQKALSHIPSPTAPKTCVSVSCYRIRALSLTRPLDRARAGLMGSEEHLCLSSFQPNTSLGLHFLCYENENPDDVLRWLSTLNALCVEKVMVWTGQWKDADMSWLSDKSLLGRDVWFETGPSRELAVVCELYGCRIVHRHLDNNIAEARNAGIDSLANNSQIRWALFVDPDEWFENEIQDCQSIRNMLASDRMGYLFKVANWRGEGSSATISDSVRISRLDRSLAMRMSGRVHESFDKAVTSAQARGIHPRLTYAPFTLRHRGLSYEPGVMDKKLSKYENLLRLDLVDDTKNPGAWVGLGWHYLNEGHRSHAEECFKNSVDCAGQSYLPYKEMAFYRLRESREMVEKCLERLSPAHHFYHVCSEMSKWLAQYAPPHPVIERGRDVDPLPLPIYEAEKQNENE